MFFFVLQCRTGPFGWCSIYFKADLVDPLGSVRAWVTASAA